MSHENVDIEYMNLFLIENDVVFIHFTRVKKLMTFGCGQFLISFSPLEEGPLAL